MGQESQDQHDFEVTMSKDRARPIFWARPLAEDCFVRRELEGQEEIIFVKSVFSVLASSTSSSLVIVNKNVILDGPA